MSGVSSSAGLTMEEEENQKRKYFTQTHQQIDHLIRELSYHKKEFNSTKGVRRIDKFLKQQKRKAHRIQALTN